VQRVETTFIARDGQRIVVEGNVSCRLKDGKPTATRAIFRDVTESKLAEMYMAQKNSELLKLNEQKNEFLGMAAHDLRNPLAVVLNLQRVPAR